jgi:MFS family permease
VIIVCFPYFLAIGPLAAAGNTILIALITFLMGFGALFNGIAPAVMAESFETKYRISGAGLGFQFSSFVIGVVISFVVSSIVASGPPTQVWPSIAAVNLVLGIVGTMGALLLKETKNIEL